MERIEALADALRVGGEHRDLQVSMVRRWLIQAVRRPLHPGCQADAILVLVGPQGAVKSTALMALASPDWYSDTAGVFAGTTNAEQFLRDPTGDRRFWVVRGTGKIDIEAIKQMRDQLWAEAVHLAEAGEQHHLTADAEALRAEAVQPHRFDDPWSEAIARVLREHRGDVIEERELVMQALGKGVIELTSRELARVRRLVAAEGWTHRRRRKDRDEESRYEAPPGRAWSRMTLPKKPSKTSKHHRTGR